MRTLPIALALFAAPVAALAQEAPAANDASELEQAFYRAFYAENGLRDFPKAAEAYAKVALLAGEAGRKDLQEKSLLGQARCLGTMGKPDLRKKVLEALLAVAPDNAEAKAMLARAGSSDAMERELRDRIASLVSSLAGPAKEQAKDDLHRVGARSIPALEDGLRGLDVGVVAGAADVLGNMDAPGARTALSRAINDPRVTFSTVVLDSLGTIARWNLDRDTEGRLLLLKEVLTISDRNLRERTLDRLMGKGYGPGQAIQVASLVAEAVKRAAPESAKELLDRFWGPDANRELFLVEREGLRSADAGIRSAVLGLAEYAPTEMAGEDAATIASVLESGSPADRVRAFRILDTRKLLKDPLRGTAFSALLSSDDAQTVRWALNFIHGGDTPFNIAAWSDGFAPGFLAALRKAVDDPGADALLRELAGMISQCSRAIPEDDLVDLVAWTKDKPRTPGMALVQQYGVEAVANRYRASSDAEVVSAAFLKGFRRLEGPGLRQWAGKWFEVASVFTPEALEALLGTTASPYFHTVAYSQIAKGGKDRPVPATPGILRVLAADLLSPEANLAGLAFQAAGRYASPELAPAVRTLIERTKDAGQVRRLLELLVACVGKDAAPDLRANLHRTADRAVRDMLVRLVGMDVVPDLVQMAVDDVSAPGILCGVAGPTYSVAVPREIVDAFLEKLPAEKRTAEILKYALGSATPARRATIVTESLTGYSADSAVVAEAAAAVRKFNMADLWPRLVPLLDHADESVRREAQESLDAIRKARDLKASFERFGEGGAGKASEDAMAMAASPEPAKRKAAALALGALGDPSGVPTLLKLVEDPDASVREAALAALERLGGRPKAEEKRR